MSLMKTNQQGYVVDSRTGMVINTNESELRSYRVQVSAYKKSEETEKKYEKLHDEINFLKQLITGGQSG